MSERESAIQPGAIIQGFTVKKVTPLSVPQGVVIELEHTACGARVLHLHTQDTENLFSVCFPTPPPDDTGVPHILEHSVLAGSQRFPVREPFFEMLKSSVATFINAMTGPDCTYYPVSSNVRQDLFNLAEVYCDAVFHPLLSESTFQREGHHLAPADPANPAGALTVSGIVYNEMKGVFSSPESKLFYTWIKRLLPDTAYALNYAGHPESIPDLTYARFKRFHEDHYHPSNAFFYFYGDIPTLDYLAFLAPRLEGMERRPPPPIPARQQHWAAPARCRETYPASQEDSLSGKTFLAMTWLTGNALDPELAVLRHVLTYILFGNEAAPLKKALIDSQLGHDILDCGDLDLGPESLFTLGIKGSEPERVDAFETVILTSLTALVKQGLKPEWVESAFQQTAYHYLEIPTLFPLHTMNRVLGAWIHGADPLTFMDMGRHLETCRSRYASDPALFSRLILEQLVNNPHRLTTVLSPDKECQARTDAAFAGRMAAERNRRTETETRRIADQAAAIEESAGIPNSPEKIALLPRLAVRDLPAKPRAIPTILSSLRISDSPSQISNLISHIPLLRNDVFSNGVNYLQFSFNLAGLPDELWSFLPHYCDAITKFGAAGMNYESMAGRVAASTGGISCSPSFQHHATIRGLPVLTLRFACKALDSQMNKAMGVLHDLVFSVDPRDRNRLRDVLAQTRSGYRSDIMENGLGYAQTHAGQYLNPIGALDEQCHGIPQVALAAQLCDHFDKESELLMDRIERIRSFILSPARLAVSFTGSDGAFETVEKAFTSWIYPKGSIEDGDGTVSDFRSQISNSDFRSQISDLKSQISNPRTGLAVPIQVAHCAQAMSAPTLINPRSAALIIGAHMVRFDYFLSEIRLKGNAYGADFSYHPLAGTLFMTSFRDPHITRTLDIFARTPDYVRSANWSQSDIDRAIIGTAKGDEKPLRPGEVTGEALARHVQGVTPELRESFYQARLAVTPEAARIALLETLEAGLGSSPVCVLASRETLEEANKGLGDKALAIHDVAM
ncbi:MAG: insulinase family protein [bacterium]